MPQTCFDGVFSQKFVRMLIVSAMTTMIAATAFGGEGKFKGYAFGDYYYVLKNHDPDNENQNGFWFRRIYFTYDNKLSDEFSMRFRLEMNSPGDFTTRAKLEPAVKDAYLKWKHKGRSVLLGISGTPTWGFVEKFWGYRSVEKTAADLYRIGSSRDFGVAVKGKMGEDKRGHYHFMVGNGSSNRSENNKGKKAALAIGYEVSPGLTLEAYGDFEERSGRTNRYTVQGFLAYKADDYRVGLQLLHQTRQTEADDNISLQFLSVFCAAKLGDNLNGFARIDRSLDPLPGASGISYIPISEAAEFFFFLFGLDYTPHKQVHLMPNFEIVKYDAVAGASPDTDIIPRFTFYYSWK